MASRFISRMTDSVNRSAFALIRPPDAALRVSVTGESYGRRPLWRLTRRSIRKVTELGIHGFGERPNGVHWFSNVAWALAQSDAFGTVWISDHLQYQDEPVDEAWTRMTWLAAAFPRVRIGSMVLGQSYRNPGLLGAMARTLQELSGGRLVLGLGAGWLEDEYRAFNFEFPSPGVRVAQLGETIELLKALWSESPATYEGEHYRLDRA